MTRIFVVCTCLGSIYRPTLVAFVGNQRMIGEEAFAQIAGENTIPMFNMLMGKALDELNETVIQHRKVPVSLDENGRMQLEVTYGERKRAFHVAAVMGMFMAQIKKRVREVTPNDADIYFSFALPPNHSQAPAIERAYKEACVIGGMDLAKVAMTDKADCIVATYLRKISGLSVPERSYLEV